MMAPPSAIFVGDGTLLIRCVEQWQDRGGKVLAIVSNDSAIVAYAARHGLSHAPLNDKLASFLERFELDYLVSAANLELLPVAALATARKMALNFHDGPLPEMAGLNVPVWAILEGRTSHAITWHEMTSGIDQGRVLVSRVFEVDSETTAFDLNARCWAEGIAAFDTLAADIISGTLTPLAQSSEGRRYYAGNKRPPRACALDPFGTVSDAARLLRALSFGPTANPVGLPRLPLPGEDFVFGGLEACDPSGAAPGTLRREGDGLRVSLADGDVLLTQLSRHGREPIDALSEPAFRDTPKLGFPENSVVTDAYERAAKHERYWTHLLGRMESLELPSVGGSGASELIAEAELGPPFGDELNTDQRALWVGLLAAALARLSSKETVFISLNERAFRREVEGLPFLSPKRVLELKVPLTGSLTEVVQEARRALAETDERYTFSEDIFARRPELRHQRVPDVELCLDSAASKGAKLALVVTAGSPRFLLLAREQFGSKAEVDCLAKVIQLLWASRSGSERVWDVSLLLPQEAERIQRNNQTRTGSSTASTVPERFAEQVARSPHRAAVRAAGQSITYLELDQRSNQLARLLQKRGVGPDVLVGAYLDRDLDTMVALLAIQKAGGAYVPLDPHYPRERVSYMLEDSGASCVVTTKKRAAELGASLDFVCVDDTASYQNELPSPPPGRLVPTHLAYCIYTSGSTGKPKGVLVEHRNLTNFFVAMDRVVAESPDPIWLAVTSLSFDISALELFYALCRGFTVVMYSPPRPRRIQARHPTRALDLSLFYFSSDVGAGQASYRLLLEGAKFADEHGFHAVWAPERHFHAFGGLFPNPAVTLAALSQITRRVRLCAGSLVSPLHHPLRIAEDYALLDNLSCGRVGLSFAAGWQPNDFVIAPENFADRKELMLRQLDMVRKLWAGEAVEFTDGTNKTQAIRTLPRPIQQPIPVWLTSAANPETFRMAAERGCNILTHLLGQTLDEVGEKIALYRRTWREAGHPGSGKITLMLHTFVGEDAATTKEIVREPLKRYLRSALDLVQKAAWTFPTFKQLTTSEAGKFSLDHLEEKDVEAIMEHSFERYYETSGLFGTAEQALEMLDRVKGIDVDEVACLIDFGIDTEQVLACLPLLAEVRRESVPEAGGEASVGELLQDHAVTHFQCTPSMAGMLLEDELASKGLTRLAQMFVGGEALPQTLAARLRGVLKGRLTNVYGPTETTVWSTSLDVTSTDAAITIGRPLANNFCHVVDSSLRPSPFGFPGELLISGAGVVRGYHGRPDLTAERFVELEVDGQKTRGYRTGDLVRWREDGELDFLGRLDFQVKIRGHRIELGEIEAVLERQPGVTRAVVVAQLEPGAGPSDMRLIAYVEAQPDSERPSGDQLRHGCRQKLPDFMVPLLVMVLDRLPLTPNGKLDRKRLPEAQLSTSEKESSVSAPPESELEEKIAAVWSALLGRANIGRSENFFDLGGHSLLAVQVTQKLRETLGREVALLDLFRYPTLEKLAKRIGGEGSDGATLKASQGRADARLLAMRARTRGRS